MAGTHTHTPSQSMEGRIFGFPLGPFGLELERSGTIVGCSARRLFIILKFILINALVGR